MFWVVNFASAAASLGDTSGAGNRRTLDETTTKINNDENTNFGLLFDTFVPLSSIVTIFAVVGFTLPRHEYFGLFWLVWWVMAVYVSLLSVNDDDANNGDIEGAGLFPSSSISDRASGVFVLVGLPLIMLFLLWMWWKIQGSRLKHNNQWGRSRIIRLPKLDPIKEFVLKNVPLWSMVAIHIYRLDGLSVAAPFWNGEVPNFVGYQTILLDVIMGITAIPLTYILYVPRNSRARGGGTKTNVSPLFLKDALWFWNSLGLYDLSSAYVVFVLNVCGWGGSHVSQPPLLPKLGKHPFPLLLLFQVPLAIAVHILMLTHSEELMTHRTKQLQNSKDFLLTLPTTSRR
mmetsp:Transcript_8991/g.22265  ORF Transcript_8991/g.22265 Transcript_8991/m.22265 type:complete len:344 (+) Transcript_8991:60-1091(+)